MNDPSPTEAADSRMRIDKWLWQARFFKSRTLAAKLTAGGGVRVNRQPIRKAHQLVAPGDILTFPQGRSIRVVEIVALGTRRGPAIEAQALYRDLDPPASTAARPAEPSGPVREAGSGRPTKRDRRVTDRLKADPS